MTPSGTPVLEVRGLAKAYRGKAVLRDLSLTLAAAEAMAVVGPNGAGKSTLLGCITGDRHPDSGSIVVCGAVVMRDLADVARCIGFVPEQPFLYDELSVGELLGFVAEARGMDRTDASSETIRLLELLGLRTAEKVLCRELSQGMARKAAIAAALLHRPRLLVLDEAFNGLDRTSADRLREELGARRASGAGLLVSSHDLDFLAAWCDRGLFLAPDASAVELSGSAWAAWRAAPSPTIDRRV
jgi:ABC-2 type transport system ATP-binding protein